VPEHPRVRPLAVGAGLFAVAIIITAFAVGGSSSSESGGASSGSPVGSTGGLSGGVARSVPGRGTGSSSGSAAVAPQEVGRGAAQHRTAGVVPNSAGDITTSVITAGNGLTATRVVKTGSLDLTVHKGQVQLTMSHLGDLASRLGGYISASQTDNVAGAPSGELTMRIPVNQFETAVSEAQRLGHQTALTTNAHDVTGKYVDINARAAALKQTRRTYLTILSRATTIGQILSVQQRVDDVQGQIEQLQGQLKVLRNQSSDGTLTVDVSQAGAAAPPVHHQAGGIGKAWHDSVNRFSRGFDAIVGALGPLLLAVILLGLAALIIRLGLRRTRRATT
jgi:hypothetical protein